ncbi:hypothetical protein PoB_004932200 [Plakobranchus ocellatus]|uniref:Uncharacterized protein n=1 Tax=Plakobranchus ocellatus TaxID=259542 RepID=A0AAV4BUY1_9GAST|nr:hypothetical protein PoB_004932200 [Plakobranchus ocellatus]
MHLEVKNVNVITKFVLYVVSHRLQHDLGLLKPRQTEVPVVSCRKVTKGCKQPRWHDRAELGWTYRFEARRREGNYGHSGHRQARASEAGAKSNLQQKGTLQISGRTR